MSTNNNPSGTLRKRAVKKPRSSEVHAYAFIKKELEALGWDVRNPDRVASGQVYTQTECLSNDEIAKHLGLERPENIVKVTEQTYWVIEAKRDRKQIDQALEEARGYAEKINDSKFIQAKIITGIAGDDISGFEIVSKYFDGRRFQPIKINAKEITGFIPPDTARAIVRDNTPEINDFQIDEELFFYKAEKINQILHLGAINKNQRARVMAALLLCRASDQPLNLDVETKVLVKDINSRVENVLSKEGKPEFKRFVSIQVPATHDNHMKFKQALVKTYQELGLLNIRSAMNSGTDVLGRFYEVFLKYGNGAKEIGIVLTPRHIAQFSAEVLNITPQDVVLDPTCGTGGFLVAAFDHVKRNYPKPKVDKFKQDGLFGVEQDEDVAALAIVNMIFRGDGKNNIVEGNCFQKHILPSNGRDAIGVYGNKPALPGTQVVTKVLMNPPFSLKQSDEKEFRFVEHALAQMQDGGLLFAILPYSALVKPAGYHQWRKHSLLPKNTLLCVITLPKDLFYPVGVHTAGIFIKKGIPHPEAQDVLWIRAINDGLLKSKGKRTPNPRASNDYQTIRGLVKKFLVDPSESAQSIETFQRSCPIDFDDPLLELVPENYLDQSLPSDNEIGNSLSQIIRDATAFMVKSGDLELLNLKSMASIANPPDDNPLIQWGSFNIYDLFQAKRGDFHSIMDLDPGGHMTVSRVTTDNGVVGYFEKPDEAEVYPKGSITISTVGGDTFLQVSDFIATDNVIVCTPKNPLTPSTLLFITFMLNRQKWRYSYGRQCYMNKVGKMNFALPIKSNGSVDEDLIEMIMDRFAFWPIIKARLA